MKRPIGRLALRIYAVSVGQHVVIAASVFAIGWLTWSSGRGPDYSRQAKYVVETVIAHAGDHDSLEREFARVHAELRGILTVYDANGQLMGSSERPQLPAMSETERKRAQDQSMVQDTRLPLTFVIPLDPYGLPGAYAIYRRPPPQLPPGPGAWTLVIALFASALASALLARSLVPALAKLTDAARRFGTGDLQARAELQRRDELGELASAFDEMAQRVALLVRSQQELLANVSHELRTPLSRIRVALDLAAEGDAQVAREALTEITEDLAELELLVADVLQMARFDLAAGHARPAQPPLRREPLDVLALLDKSATRFRATHPTRALELVVDGALPELDADSVLLRRVVDNLLDNARKYSDERSTVTMRARSDANAFVLSVEDHGIGISKEDLERVTTPFFRVDRSRTRSTGGLGLGLSLSRAIVAAHEGTLTIDSELGVGTTARIHLPIAAPAAAIDVHALARSQLAR